MACCETYILFETGAKGGYLYYLVFGREGLLDRIDTFLGRERIGLSGRLCVYTCALLHIIEILIA